ncbi:MAG: superoxide dismutase family protein [Steroidobacteraceae bacterium]
MTASLIDRSFRGKSRHIHFVYCLSRSLAMAALLLSACTAPQEFSEATARAVLRPASGSQVSGMVTFTQIATDRVRITGEVSGHNPGRKGFHIHEKGDCSAHDG